MPSRIHLETRDTDEVSGVCGDPPVATIFLARLNAPVCRLRKGWRRALQNRASTAQTVLSAATD